MLRGDANWVNPPGQRQRLQDRRFASKGIGAGPRHVPDDEILRRVDLQDDDRDLGLLDVGQQSVVDRGRQLHRRLPFRDHVLDEGHRDLPVGAHDQVERQFGVLPHGIRRIWSSGPIRYSGPAWEIGCGGGGAFTALSAAPAFATTPTNRKTDNRQATAHLACTMPPPESSDLTCMKTNFSFCYGKLLPNPITFTPCSARNP